MPYTVCIADAQYICNEICIIRDLVIIFKEDFLLMLKKTRLVCTMGPACDNEETLRKMMENGMNVAIFHTEAMMST